MPPINISLIDAKDIPGVLTTARAAIHARIDQEIETVFPPEKDCVAFNLFHAITSFRNPEEPFKLWRDYYCKRIDRSGLERNIAREEIFNPGMSAIEDRESVLKAYLEACQDAAEVLSHDHACDKPFRATIVGCLEAMVEGRWATSLPELKRTASMSLISVDLLRQAHSFLFTKFDDLTKEACDYILPVERKSLAGLSCQVPEDQIFGVEFEGFFPSSDGLARNIKVLRNIFSSKEVGLKAICDEIEEFRAEGAVDKERRSYREWLITVDATVTNPFHFLSYDRFDRNYGMEIISPLLQGEEGVRALARATRTLNEHRFMTNSTCGFHVNVGMRDASLDEARNLAEAFVKNEASLDAYISPARRGRNNPFAASQHSIDIGLIRQAGSMEQLVTIMSPHYSGRKFDITSMVESPDAARVQYRAEGGVGYMDQAVPYTILLVHFTKMGRVNRDITVEQVLAAIQNDRYMGSEPQAAGPRAQPVAAKAARL